MAVLTHIRDLSRDTRGAALVEFTLVAPLLIALMCGLAEFGQALRQYHVMAKGVGDAARYLARVPGDPACVSPGSPDPSWGSYVTPAKNLVLYGSTASGTPLFKGWTDPATVSVDADTCLANPRVDGLPLPRIRVTASTPYDDLGMLSALGLTAPTLTVSHEELRVR